MSATTISEKIGNFVKGIPGAITGMIVFPLTAPFLTTANRFRSYNEKNITLWKKYTNRKGRLPEIYYLVGAFHIMMRIIFLSVMIPIDFALNVVVALFNGALYGHSEGIAKTLMQPEATTNVFDYEGYKRGAFEIRSQHLLILALFLAVVGGIAGVALLGAGLFSPLSYLSSHLGIHIFRTLGIRHATQIMYWVGTYLVSAGVAAAATAALSAVVFTFMRLSHGLGSLIESLSPKDGNDWKQNLQQLIEIPKHIGHFLNQILGVAIGLPIYMLFKPAFQLLHSARTCIRSNRKIYRSGWKRAELRYRFLAEWFFKLVTVVHVLLNTAVRFVLFPFQCLASLLYAPYQCVRHATKYGLAHVLSYPYHYMNNYRATLKYKDSDKKYEGYGSDYDNLTMSQYDNVYYFKLKHVLILSLVVGLIFLGLTGILALHGYLAINVTLKLLTPLGLNTLHLAGTSVALFNFMAGVIMTNAGALAVYVAARVLSIFSSIASSIEHVIRGARRFNSVFHKVVSAGEAVRIMKKENLVVKTIASKVRKEKRWEDEEKQRNTLFGPSWIFNIEQLKNPSGFNPIGKNTPRPVYLEKEQQRQYRRNATYKRWNPKNGETEKRKMKGVRGRARPDLWLKHYLSLGLFPMHTKKTSVSLAPKDGMMAFFGGREDAVGIAFDLRLLDRKDDKYVWDKDVYSNLKWWWQGKEADRHRYGGRSITIQELRNNNRNKRLSSKVPEHNEILAGINKEALRALVVSTDSQATRINALLRKLILKRELGVDLPILVMGKLSGSNEKPQIPNEYGVEQQIVDLYSIIKIPGWFDNGAAALKQVAEYYEGKGLKDAKSKFVQTLVNSNHVNWATVFGEIDNKNIEDFKDYIEDTAGVDLRGHTHHKFSETHLLPNI